MTAQTSGIGLTVVLEFDIEPEEEGPLREGTEEFLRSIVTRQPGFVGTSVHVSRDARKVLTFLWWESLDAYERFRDDEQLQRKVRPIVGPYGPTTRVYDVVFSTGRATPSPPCPVQHL